jgi:hypothetical protein
MTKSSTFAFLTRAAAVFHDEKGVKKKHAEEGAQCKEEKGVERGEGSANGREKDENKLGM